MDRNIKEFKLQDICKEVSSGNLDYRIAMLMINSIANTLTTYSDMNILIDQRETSFRSVNFNEILEVLEGMDSLNIPFTNKTANVLPNDHNRVQLARLIKTILNLADDKYKVFTDYDEAVRWLSD